MLIVVPKQPKFGFRVLQVKNFRLRRKKCDFRLEYPFAAPIRSMTLNDSVVSPSMSGFQLYPSAHARCRTPSSHQRSGNSTLSLRGRRVGAAGSTRSRASVQADENRKESKGATSPYSEPAAFLWESFL